MSDKPTLFNILHYVFISAFIDQTRKNTRVTSDAKDFKCQIAIDNTRVTITFDAVNDYGEFVLKKLFDRHAEEEIKKA